MCGVCACSVDNAYVHVCVVDNAHERLVWCMYCSVDLCTQACTCMWKPEIDISFTSLITPCIDFFETWSFTELQVHHHPVAVYHLKFRYMVFRASVGSKSFCNRNIFTSRLMLNLSLLAIWLLNEGKETYFLLYYRENSMQTTILTSSPLACC